MYIFQYPIRSFTKKILMKYIKYMYNLWIKWINME